MDAAIAKAEEMLRSEIAKLKAENEDPQGFLSSSFIETMSSLDNSVVAADEYRLTCKKTREELAQLQVQIFEF